MAQGPQKQQPKRGFRTDIGVILIIILVIVGIIFFMQNAKERPDSLSMAYFEHYLNEGKIKEVKVTPIGGENDDLLTIKGTYIDETGIKKNYVIVVLKDHFEENLLPIILQKEAADVLEYSVVPLKTVDWLSIISFIVPIVLFIGFMVFLFRNTASGNNRAFDFGKSRARMARHSKVTFKDVAGVDEEIEE